MRPPRLRRRKKSVCTYKVLNRTEPSLHIKSSQKAASNRYTHKDVLQNFHICLPPERFFADHSSPSPPPAYPSSVVAAPGISPGTRRSISAKNSFNAWPKPLSWSATSASITVGEAASERLMALGACGSGRLTFGSAWAPELVGSECADSGRILLFVEVSHHKRKFGDEWSASGEGLGISSRNSK